MSPTHTLPAVTAEPLLAPLIASPPRRESPTKARRPTIDISVCIANWNCRDYLRNCLESLHDLPHGVRLEVIVVDNASTDGAPEMVERDFPQVILIRNKENRGFATASNQAARRARGRYLFFLNNDTIVPPGALRELLDFADAHPEAGLIGPRLRDGHGNLQISYRRLPTLAALLHRTSLFRWSGLLRSAYYHYRRSNFSGETTRPVEVLMGAAVLMRRELFEDGGEWDETFRFGGEDIDLSSRIGRRAVNYFLAAAEITHFGRVSSRQNISFAAPNVAIGYVHYLRKAGYSRTAVRFYKMCVLLDGPLQLLEKSIQYLWRRFRGRHIEAEKTQTARRGIRRFLTHELPRFVRA